MFNLSNPQGLKRGTYETCLWTGSCQEAILIPGFCWVSAPLERWCGEMVLPPASCLFLRGRNMRHTLKGLSLHLDEPPLI